MIATRTLRFCGWTLIWVFSFLLLWNSRFYLLEPMRVPFFRERIDSVYPGWGLLLRVHIAGGMICLLTGPLLFLSPQLRWVRHRSWGLLYLAAALLMLPTGILLSFSAHGGWFGQAGFLLSGMWMCFCVLRGMQWLTLKNFRLHADWMARSYAIAASALTFRLVYAGSFLLQVPYGINYPLSTWISSVLNVLLMEFLLRSSFVHHTLTKASLHETETYSPPPRPVEYGIPLREGR